MIDDAPGSTLVSSDPPPRDPLSDQPPDPPLVAMADVPLERIETELCALGAHIDAAVCRWLGFVAEFDRREGYLVWECRSTANWLAWKCGVSMVTGREYVRVARALEGLPRIKAEFTAGRLSYSKVRAITRIAHEENEKTLVDLAHDSTASVLDTVVRQYRRFGDASGAGDAWRSYENREFSWYHDDNGDVVFNGRLPADMGAVVIKMISAARQAIDTENASAEAPGDRENASAEARPVPAATPGEELRARNADALVLAAESFLTHGAVHREGSDRCDLTVIADIDTLIDAPSTDSPPADTNDVSPESTPTESDPGAPAAGDPIGWPGITDRIGRRAHIHGGAPLHSHVVRRLACDCVASIVGLGADGDPMYASRHQRTVNARLRRALKIRDRCCTFPGCDQRAFLQAHHIIHWVDGGLTITENMALVCGKHHRAVHEGGCIMMRSKTGELVVYSPDGRRFDNQPTHIENPGDLETQNAAHGLNINHQTHRCHWQGRGPNMSDIIFHLDLCQDRHTERHTERHDQR